MALVSSDVWLLKSKPESSSQLTVEQNWNQNLLQSVLPVRIGQLNYGIASTLLLCAASSIDAAAPKSIICVFSEEMVGHWEQGRGVSLHQILPVKLWRQLD